MVRWQLGFSVCGRGVPAHWAMACGNSRTCIGYSFGTRLVIANQLVHDDDPRWYKGPPYAIPEATINPCDFSACSLSRHDGSARFFSDAEFERFKLQARTTSWCTREKSQVRSWTVLGGPRGPKFRGQKFRGQTNRHFCDLGAAESASPVCRLNS